MKRKRHISFVLLPLHLLIFIGLFSCAPIKAQSRSFLLALSKQDHTLAIVDAKTLTVIGKVPVGDDPHEVVASSDGKTAYVSIQSRCLARTGLLLQTINYGLLLRAQKLLAIMTHLSKKLNGQWERDKTEHT
jgi:YVTN family beta-propeller protein